MDAGILIGGIAFVGFGVLMLWKRDWMWALTEMGNSMRGQVSERSDWWEFGNTVSAIILIVVGAVLALFALGER
jgi:hypothetical protein